MIFVSLQEREDSYQLNAHSKVQNLEQIWPKSSLNEWATPDGAHTQKRRPQKVDVPRSIRSTAQVCKDGIREVKTQLEVQLERNVKGKEGLL